MTVNRVEKWLLQEAEKGNVMASSYLSLLKDATPEMKTHWFNFLGSMITPVLENEKEIRQSLKEGK